MPENDTLRYLRRTSLTIAAVALSTALASARAADPSPQAAPRPDAPPTAPSGAPAPPSGTKRIVYVPESVKAEIRDELKKEVLEQAKAEGWATPNEVPAWLRRFHFGGDVRVRFERILYPSGNANSGEFPDFNGINTGGRPFDVNFIDPANQHYLDTDQNRTRPRLRTRFDVDVDVAEGFTSGLRLAVGDNNGPVTTTTLASTGNFSRYAFWLDRAFINLRLPLGGGSDVKVTFGRFENPFFATDLMWSDLVSMDGVELDARLQLGDAFRPFGVIGAFPLYTTALDFATDQTSKYPSIDKWLFAMQLGTDWKASDRIAVKLGAAFYYFSKVEGRISLPCDTNLSTTSCNTDVSRPAFAQKGNTYMPIRTPSDAALQAEAGGLSSQYQYFGLASRFRDLELTGRVSYRVAPRLQATLEGEFVRNVGFSRAQIQPVALNNRGACDAAGNCTQFVGGANGYLGRIIVGTPTQNKRWDWNVALDYRRLESDAVIDAWVNPDFGLGGTNLKGYVIGAGLAVADGVWASGRWLSAEAVAGPPYGVDILQIDLLARF